MARYYVDFINKTDQDWTFALFQTVPGSEGLDSVSWLRAKVVGDGISGFTWDTQYNVAIADYKQDGGREIYQVLQIKDTQIGTDWDITWNGESQKLEPHGNGLPGLIRMFNKSGQIVNPGIGISGHASIYKKGVLSGMGANFEVSSVFGAAICENNVVEGEVIERVIIAGPWQIVFSGNSNLVTFTASIVDHSLVIDQRYSSRYMVSLDAILARTRASENGTQ